MKCIGHTKWTRILLTLEKIWYQYYVFQETTNSMTTVFLAFFQSSWTVRIVIFLLDTSQFKNHILFTALNVLFPKIVENTLFNWYYPGKATLVCHSYWSHKPFYFSFFAYIFQLEIINSLAGHVWIWIIQHYEIKIK